MAMLAALEHQPRGLADLQREFGGDLGVGAAANAVGAEILAPHRKFLLGDLDSPQPLEYRILSGDIFKNRCIS